MFDRYQLEAERKKKGMSTDELIGILGISKSAYYRKLKGQTEFTRSEIQKITDALHLASPMDIFFADEVS